ncbi:exodeoxyribonuclease VII, large subunit [Enterococcus asini ATCC 700915]|uniref:Exodeoxyribonuclease 7 large subunit n=1 Tax=Enterococcus asini ATCC 700915 TaxID=1158606 RepID=R2RUP5_9ENTE|nr:exodeoxyribonuclease VII large subunit [Enterococcus asini]EOH87030.1 exodeoxyribonuclease VII, large subunit [Enterococcus asini ATCC 700915]EOT58047.1 exodeoxyribonuclease VII, large subunit [Enterococcus asini ATCC 700915]
MTQEYLSVTALTKYLKRKFDADPYLERVFLTGEISNFRLRPNHQYFSLKDDGAKISAVMFKSAFSKVKFRPEEGMKVLVVGRISLFEASGNYQIYVEQMQPDGVGALYQAYEQLKEKLAKEGLFSAPKKPLPRYPKKIAVITSPSGAVIRDIITTVRRRYPIAQLVLFPTVVQGDKAAPDIIRNLDRVQAQGDFDTVILGRGGGSIEDLWPFNEESVARALFAMKIPVISSVGHETDTTIADLVADVRAATPTAAAELAVPVLSEELLRLKQQDTRLEQAFSLQLQRKNERYQRALASYVFRDPNRLYEAQSLKLDQLTQRLLQASQQRLYEAERYQQKWASRLQQASPLANVHRAQQDTTYLTKQLRQATQRLLENKQTAFANTVQSLDLLSPLKIMSRGYTFTTKDEQVLKSREQVALGDELTIHFADGQVRAQVTEFSAQGLIPENQE